MTITWITVVIVAIIGGVYHIVTKTDTFLTALANLKDKFISSAPGNTRAGTTPLAGGTRDEPNTTTPQDNGSENPEDASRRFRKTYRSIKKENDAFLYRLQSLEEQKRNWRSHRNIPLSAAQERVAREHHVFVAAKVAAFDLDIPAFRTNRDTNTICCRLEGFAKAADVGGARRYLETFAGSTGIDS